MPEVKSIHHVAVVVQDLESALSFWRDALGMIADEVRDVPAERSRVAFLPLHGAELELVLPTSSDSGIARYLAKRGPGMHHICLEVDDLPGLLRQLTQRGVRVIGEEQQSAVDGRRYAFIHPESSGGVLVELYQEGGD